MVMTKSTYIIIFVLVGLLVIGTYFRFSAEDMQQQRDSNIIENMSKSIQILTDISEDQQAGQKRGQQILEEQEKQRQEANITTKGFVDRFNTLFNIIEEEERQRKIANINVSDFINEFHTLSNEVHETLGMLNRSITNEGVLQTTVSRLQLDAAASVENERTFLLLLTDLGAKLDHLDHLVRNMTLN